MPQLIEGLDDGHGLAHHLVIAVLNGVQAAIGLERYHAAEQHYERVRHEELGTQAHTAASVRPQNLEDTMQTTPRLLRRS